jgi:hypothetical protein
VRLANLLSPDGQTWGDIMAWQNSGTYNNAYGVLDLKLFAPGEALPPNTLTYVEQIPGLVFYGDVTRELEKGHMPMYNVPYWCGFSLSTRNSGVSVACKLPHRLCSPSTGPSFMRPRATGPLSTPSAIRRCPSQRYEGAPCSKSKLGEMRRCTAHTFH